MSTNADVPIYLIDLALVESARDGHWAAVSAVCEFAARACSKQWQAAKEEQGIYVVSSLRKIGDGKSPNEAFGFALVAKGRPKKISPPPDNNLAIIFEGNAGTRDTIKRMCRAAAASLVAETRFTDPAMKDYLVSSLSKVGAGATPNHAFGFNSGRKGNTKKLNDFRDWEIRVAVQELMIKWDVTANAIIDKIASDRGGPSLYNEKTLKRICVRLKKDTEIPLPLTVFPLPSRMPAIFDKHRPLEFTFTRRSRRKK